MSCERNCRYIVVQSVKLFETSHKREMSDLGAQKSLTRNAYPQLYTPSLAVSQYSKRRIAAQ